MTEGSTSAPANVTEFNANVGHVFAQLYEHFPVSIERLNRETIASAMGVPSSGESTYVLPSGRSFSQVFAHSLTWLSDEGYIRARGASPSEHVMLTEKGMAALNAVPRGLSTTIGTSLVQAVTGESPKNWSGVGDLVGGFFGGLTKSMSGS